MAWWHIVLLLLFAVYIVGYFTLPRASRMRSRRSDRGGSGDAGSPIPVTSHDKPHDDAGRGEAGDSAGGDAGGGDGGGGGGD